MNSSVKNYFNRLMSKFSDPQAKFIRAIIYGNLPDAKKHAYELYRTYPQYLTFFCYINIKDHKQVLLAILKRLKKVDPQLVYCLSQSNDVSYSELLDISSQFSGSSFIECCIRKAMLIKKSQEAGKIYNKTHDGIELSPTIKITRDEINRMISDIDDFALYDLAIKHNIEIDPKESVNYLWYLVTKNKCVKSATRILQTSTSFREISNLIQKFVDRPEELEKVVSSSKTYKTLTDYLTQGYDRDLLHASWHLFNNEATVFNLKLLLALLIASKDERNLVLAFYLSSKYASSDNYEIDLIHLFLNRYFMFHVNIAKRTESLYIKHIQLHNLAYIFSDPMILSSLRFRDSINAVKLEVKSQVASIENALRSFIDLNRIAGAASLLALRERLMDSVVVQEIEHCKILCTEPKTMFSDLLGDGCSYMFDKITVNDVRMETGSISSIRNKKVESFTNEIFNNEIFPITDKIFIDSFIDMNGNKCRRGQ